MIYGLTNKETGKVRYVGRTSRKLNVRMNSHGTDARTGRRDSPVAKWIRKINPSSIDIILLEKDAENDAKAEVWWMEYMEFLGCNLLNEIRHELPLGDQDGIDVTSEMKEMMGSVPDTEIAEKFEISKNTVYKHRRRLEIEGWSSKIELPKECIEQLGEKPDAKLAEEFNKNRSVVRRRREERGIDPFYKFKGNGNVEFSKEAKRKLGSISDKKLAGRFGLTRTVVRNRRIDYGIDPAIDNSYVEIPVEELGTKPDNELAEEYDVSPRTVCERRKEHGIEAWKRQNRLSDEKVGEVKWLAINSDMTYVEIGNRYGISDANVSAIKNEKRRSNVECVKPERFEKQIDESGV